MKCRNWGEKIPGNPGLSFGPSGQEPPGLFLSITAIRLVITLFLITLAVRYCPGFPLAWLGLSDSRLWWRMSIATTLPTKRAAEVSARSDS